MGSRFQFQPMTEQQARDILAMHITQAEFYPDKLRAERRLRPVSTFEERVANRKWLAELREHAGLLMCGCGAIVAHDGICPACGTLVVRSR